MYYDTIQYIIQRIHQLVTITVETVAAAADRLHGDGTNPTQSAVRTALGGGSFSTIGPLLHKRRDNQAEAAELAKVDLPDTLADAGFVIWRLSEIRGTNRGAFGRTGPCHPVSLSIQIN